MSRGLQANYDAIPVKDADTIYICIDTGNTYLGDKKLDADWVTIDKPQIILNSGLKVFLNGVDVTNNSSVQTLDAKKQWFGTAASYARLVRDNEVQNDVAYHLMPNPDWEEKDEESLAYIMHKPTILDAKMNENHTMKLDFFYK